jgi:hypothetical protein
VPRPHRQKQGLLVDPLDRDGKILELDPKRPASGFFSQVHQREVEVAVREPRQERSRMGLPEGDAETRVLAMEPGDESGDTSLGQRLQRGAEADRAAARRPESRHLFGRRLGLHENPPRARREADSGFRQGARAGAALDQRHAQLALERADLLRERRLGHVQPLGGRREAHRVRNG